MNRSLKISLSSTCQISVERIVLDLESEVMRGPGSINTGGNIFHWIFWMSRGKASDANIDIIVNFVSLRKPSNEKEVYPRALSGLCKSFATVKLRC